MTRGKTVVHFLTAGCFIFLAIMLFRLANGKIDLAPYIRPEGGQRYKGFAALAWPLALTILCLAGMITTLNDGLFSEWAPAAGVILLLMLGGYWFGMARGVMMLVAGIYFIWWAIAGIKSLIASWYDLEIWQNMILAIARILIAATLLLVVITLFYLPMVHADSYVLSAEAIKFSKWAGIAGIATGALVFFEGVLWARYCDY
jgi:hypothetical protein